MLFFKPFKVKKNATLRDTNRKKLIERVVKELAIPSEDADSAFRGKVATEVKIHTNDRRDVTCYLFDGVPYVFNYEERLYPTVFLLSSVSSSRIPIKYVSDSLIEQIYRGSDIVPRYVIASDSKNPESKSFEIFSLAAYSGSDSNIQVSKPLVVCILNSIDRNGSVLHFAKDKLCELCPPHVLSSYKIEEKISPNSTTPDQFLENTEQIDEEKLEDHKNELVGDQLLMYCFLYALCKLPKSVLPLPVNVFYAKYMKLECPKGSTLDIKKTSFKKVNVFLDKMEEMGFISLEKVSPDVIKLVSIQKKHPKFFEHILDFPELEYLALNDEVSENSTVQIQQSASCIVGDFYFGPPTFEEQRTITSRIAPFLASVGYKVGESVAPSELCQIVGTYIDSKNLRCLEDRNLINLDEVLMQVSDTNLYKEAPGYTLSEPKYQITFSDLIKSLTKGLKVVYKVTYPRESGLSPRYIPCSTLPKIKMYEAMQNGKHVTRIGGLHNYGIDMKSFSRYIQTKLACSTNLTEDPRSGNAAVVQAQGSHCIALSKLLTQTFKLRKEWIDGYQEPVKKGKKKK